MVAWTLPIVDGHSSMRAVVVVARVLEVVAVTFVNGLFIKLVVFANFAGMFPAVPIRAVRKLFV